MAQKGKNHFQAASPQGASMLVLHTSSHMPKRSAQPRCWDLLSVQQSSSISQACSSSVPLRVQHFGSSQGWGLFRPLCSKVNSLADHKKGLLSASGPTSRKAAMLKGGGERKSSHQFSQMLIKSFFNEQLALADTAFHQWGPSSSPWALDSLQSEATSDSQHHPFKQGDFLNRLFGSHHTVSLCKERSHPLGSSQRKQPWLPSTGFRVVLVGRFRAGAFLLSTTAKIWQGTCR